MSYVLSGSARRFARWARSTSSAARTTPDLEVDAKVELIRSLVPLGLLHVEEVLDEEVTALAGKVLVFETVMPETPEPHPAKFMDLNMLAMTEGGSERTEKEFAGLFESAGLRLQAIYPTKTPVSVSDQWHSVIRCGAVRGHWEGDLLVGARNSYVATLVERRSRYVCLVRITGKETQTVVRALTRHVQRLPAGLMATLTWDRGLELAAHRTFSIATGVQVYFCDPQSPWQRGARHQREHQRPAAAVLPQGHGPVGLLPEVPR